MYVVSASRRTDIPAFYSPWFINRVRAGFALVPNPFNPHQISTVRLSPEKVACFAFITKDPRPLLQYLPELDKRGHRYFFQVTLTGMPSIFEPGVPPAAAIVAAIRQLAASVGAGRVIWRFDPILLSRITPPEKVVKTFGELAAQLDGAVDRVIISFADGYRQVKQRIAQQGIKAVTSCRFLDPAEIESVGATLAASMSDIAQKRGMSLYSCAEKFDLTASGVKKGSCIESTYVKETFGVSVSPSRGYGQRGECWCIKSVDIGIYGTCHHRCVYCYARVDSRLSGSNKHDPESPFLLDPLVQPPQKQKGQLISFDLS